MLFMKNTKIISVMILFHSTIKKLVLDEFCSGQLKHKAQLETKMKWKYTQILLYFKYNIKVVGYDKQTSDIK